MLIPLHQRSIILEFLALRKGFDAASGVGLSTPESDIPVITAGKDVFIVWGECRAEDALHALCVVDVS